MNNQIKYEQLIIKKEQLMSSWDCTVTPEMEMEKKDMIKSFKHQSHSQRQTYTLINIPKGNLESNHISPDENGNATESSYAKIAYNHQLLEMTHLSEKLFTLKLEIAIFEYLQQLTPQQIPNFRLNYQRRLRTDSGEYQCYIHSITVAICDAAHQPWLLQVVTKPCKLNPAEDPERYRIFCIQPSNEIKNFNKYWDGVNIYLTESEKEILLFTAKGHSKLDIAEMTFRSEKTVKSHCSNILRKLCVNSMPIASNKNDKPNVKDQRLNFILN